MDRKRIREEILEILSNKLHRLPPPPADGGEEDIDYDAQRIKPEITENHLDIAEVAMDLEDAFGFNFEDALPGDAGLETIGQVVEFIERKVNRAKPRPAKG